MKSIFLIYIFKTSGNWETITIPLNKMYASFRGRILNMPNFNNDYFEQITFLVGNKKNEKFKLLLDQIILEKMQKNTNQFKIK